MRPPLNLARVASPRVRALINGVTIDTVTHFNIVAGGSCRASRCDLTLRVPDNAGAALWLVPNIRAVRISVFVRFDENIEEVRLFEGIADLVEFDPIKNLARVRGRDYSAILMSSSNQGAFCNQTASEIAETIATRHGFDTNIVETVTLVGSQSNEDHDQMLLNAYSQFTSEWDLLTHMAQIERFELYFEGSTLNFAPRTALIRDFHVLTRDDVRELRFRKACSPAPQTSIVMKSWDTWLDQSSESTSELRSDPTGLSATGPIGARPIEYVLVKPNLGEAYLERLGAAYSAAMSEQSLMVDIVVPGWASLRTYDIVTLQGLFEGFDQEYLIRSARWSFSATTGFLQYVRGHAVRSDSFFWLNMEL